VILNIPRHIPSGIEYNPVLHDYRYIENDSILPALVRYIARVPWQVPRMSPAVSCRGRGKKRGYGGVRALVSPDYW